ncbi:MAG: hypothetical protein CMM58_10105, partial [Rhodospirillaceae bacterium]|nr:hypothetical protein [Rhodospirillaceae bacterium]
MSSSEIIDDSKDSGGHQAGMNFIPPLERTEGQPAPIAANGGRSYISFDRGGDGGSAAATEEALSQIAERESKGSIDPLDNISSGPINTKWGVGFRDYDECVKYIKDADFDVPEGGVALPLRYSINEYPSYSVVPSNALWDDPSRRQDAEVLKREEERSKQRALYFPKILRDARRISDYYPGLSPRTPECMDKLGVSLAHCDSK